MNKWQISTIIFIAVVAVGVIVYDIFAAISKDNHDTVSWIIAYFCWRIGILPYFIGVMVGHFTVGIERLKKLFVVWVWISALLLGSVIAMALTQASWYWPPYAVAIGIIFGTIFWNQGTISFRKK